MPLESEAGFRVLFEYATISILVIGEAGIIELANPCAEKLFGYKVAELIGQPLEILLPEDLRHRHINHREGYFKKPKARPMGLGIELRARKKDGHIFPVEISLGHYEFEGDKLAVAFVTDITEHVNARKLIADSEAWFKSMADNAPVMIWVSGADKLCTYFNNAWLEFTGRMLKQEIGSGWTEGVHCDDLEHCLRVYSEAFDARKSFRMTYRLRRNDGKYRWILDVGKPTYTSENVFAGYIGSCSDIHDQLMAQEELEKLVHQRTIELSEALDREKFMSEMKSRFVSMASHEFRTPLSVVLSSTSLIEQYLKPEHDEKIGRHTARIKSTVYTLTGILNDFLSLDKLEQGKLEIEYELFDLPDFTAEAIEEVGPMKKSGQTVIVSHVGGKQILQDKKMLRYIILNLLSNSIKYSPEGKGIYLYMEVTDSSLKITVKDEGIGIPEEEQKNMYNKFFRAKNTANIQGTGLGLTIVKRYTELLNGTVQFYSKINEGTTFTIELPHPAVE